MKVAIYQYDILWKDAKANLEKVENALSNATLEGVDLLVLPEMFNTGFCMEPQEVAELNEGATIQTIKRLSKKYDMAICGSFASEDGGKFYNRGFFICPDGSAFYRDKKHLFSIGKEAENYAAGIANEVISYKGWNIRLLVCYDLRFPVWSRNRDNEYDLLIYVANWPASRISTWNILLPARAVENEAFVCGCNRIGKDGMGFPHDGHSAAFDYKGKLLLDFELDQEALKVVELSQEELVRFRTKFPAYRDADAFVFSEGSK
ncbi:MAG: nitrilase family protein [Paludibacteraceae bacterium]|nr:nitrilase family protein [Paludibacteraceae bacterium]